MRKTSSLEVQTILYHLDVNTVRLVSFMCAKIWTNSCSWWYVENLLANTILLTPHIISLGSVSTTISIFPFRRTMRPYLKSSSLPDIKLSWRNYHYCQSEVYRIRISGLQSGGIQHILKKPGRIRSTILFKFPDQDQDFQTSFFLFDSNTIIKKNVAKIQRM